MYCKKALFVRVDRIGDLVLTLPVDQVSDLNKYDITWWIADGLGFVIQNGEKPRAVRSIKKEFSWQQCAELLGWVLKEEFDMSIVFHAPWWVSAILWLADIPVRVGRRSQWYSYLFFNKGLRQSRSQSEKHESEYNFELLSFALDRKIEERPVLELHNPNAESVLKRLNLQPKTYYVVHPGMGGSARNVSVDFYVKLITELSQKSLVAVTGTQADRYMTDPIFEKLKNAPNVISLVGILNGGEVIAVLENSKGVVAPSTGVVHLAASTGVKTIALYSPVLSQHPNRWGPRGNDVKILMPEVQCPGTKQCLFQKCDKYDCMDQIDTEKVRRTFSGDIHDLKSN